MQKNLIEEVIDAKTGDVVIKLGDKINFLNAKKLSNDGLKDILVTRDSLFGKFLHRDVKVNDEFAKNLGAKDLNDLKTFFQLN